MTLLPFKTSTQKQEYSTINDGIGNSLNIPKHNCLTVGESIIYHSYTMIASKDTTLAFNCYKIELVFRLLVSRFNLPETATKEDVFRMKDKSIGEPMIEAIYDFFERERMRWQQAEKETTEEKKEKPV